MSLCWAGDRRMCSEFMAEMESTRARCELIEAHLEDIERCQEAIAEVEERFGSIYGLVNNAGVNDGVGLESGSVEKFVQSLQKNLIHYYALAHYALPALKRMPGIDRQHQFQGRADRAGRHFGICRVEGRATGSYARVGRGAAAL